MDDAAQAFYQNHCGGSGAVVVVIAVSDKDSSERLGIFGSLEKAKEWRDTLGDEWSCVYSPHVVDEPDYGNVSNA